jgi:hypothetical protein
MLLSVHAIWASAWAPTAEHQRRRPRMAGDRAGKQNRQFIAFATSATVSATSSPCMAQRLSPSLGHTIVRAKRRRPSSSSAGDDGRSTTLVGRNDGGARTRHRWRRWWVSLELRAGFLSALCTVPASMPSRWPFAASDRAVGVERRRLVYDVWLHLHLSTTNDDTFAFRCFATA